ncbi:polysaccharide biosynthesis C-terminal domain-containing protein [Polaribacter cellanae]|uniref:Polysaccharide biosynthesis C-terminal domain-containing protein n=1 Tax=Polaribacter cellanae TaxID=2818493 RepID=A0A975H7X9_9FLAO|nr:polysaccharide biosynthesis C-terminal domain-containing protein [Polaribacter cellanae]QTE23986.1 polysaccharide biosynthesis C-terminal domain-containing protein [Polaribacter cellanae]
MARIFSLFASWIALKLIPDATLGVVLFSYNIILFLLPVSGFGLHQSLLRFSAISKNNEEKNTIFLYVLKYGLIASLIIIFVVVIASLFIPFQFEKTQQYVIVFSLLIIPTFLFEIIRAQLRLNHDNKNYAYSEFLHSIILVVSVFGFTYFFDENGYVFALLITPLVTALVFLKKTNIIFSRIKKIPQLNFSFWKYGFFASLSNVITQLLIVVDILLIGFLLDDPEMVTKYRYISLVPFSLLFIPRVFITTDFVTITEKISDKNYILNYIKSYLSFFTVLSVLMLFFVGYFSSEILAIFNPNYIVYNTIFRVLILGIAGIFIFRNLFGNLLSSIGKAYINFYIAFLSLLLNVISNYYLIPKYGILGAAITSASLMWFTGILSGIWFLFLYQKKHKNQ